MNSQRTKQHISKLQNTSRCFSLQKSCFLADAHNYPYYYDKKNWQK
ncbi:hypothetical protein BA6E_103233 [Bacteroidales bacterium 6E]|nr:hypothetical protein BA6E_103233 [Bacteroidales bacterium 6E]